MNITAFKEINITITWKSYRKTPWLNKLWSQKTSNFHAINIYSIHVYIITAYNEGNIKSLRKSYRKTPWLLNKLRSQKTSNFYAIEKL